MVRATVGLEPQLADAIRHKLLQLHTSCGCQEGSVLMLAATAAAIAYFVIAGQLGSIRSTALIIVGVMLGSGALGKVIGLAIARTRFFVLLRQLESARGARPDA
ncbi:MAG: hypothetical protein WKF41_05530 [Gaiellaceae bacterium]